MDDLHIMSKHNEGASVITFSFRKSRDSKPIKFESCSIDGAKPLHRFKLNITEHLLSCKPLLRIWIKHLPHKIFSIIRNFRPRVPLKIYD